MPDGGYPLWGAFQPTLRNIFRNIFELSQSNDAAAKSFISQYYRGLYSGGSNTSKPILSLSFLSDLVELPSANLNN
jgi:hypothetical protein